jgi:hypothetical protein
VALAASLVDHAVTLTDEKAEPAERVRAHDLLDRAWKLGNTSPLAMNLSPVPAAVATQRRDRVFEGSTRRTIDAGGGGGVCPP